MNYKICTKCREELPATDEFFYKRSSGKFGLHAHCKKCFSRRCKRYYRVNEEHIKAQVKKYRATPAGKESKRKCAKKYKRSDVGKAANKRWKKSEKGRISARKSAIKIYYKNQLTSVISSHLYQSLKENKGHRHCFDLLPYTLKELKAHIENLWLTGMTWGNYGRGGWHLDHVKPKAAFDKDKLQDINSKEFIECWAIENLQPLWQQDNLSKAANYKDVNYRLHE